MADEIFTKADAALEGETNVVLDDLASLDGEITLEQLRTIPGTVDLSDEELKALWADAQKDGTPGSTGTNAAGTSAAAASASAAPTGTPSSAAQQRAWKLYGTDDKEVADFKAMTVEQFLAAKIGYTANKAEQKKTLDELIRVAQYGHLNEGRFSTAQNERNTLAKQLEELQPQYQTLQSQQKQLLFALDQYIAGNQQPLKSLVEGYANALSNRNASHREEPAAAPAATADDSAGLKVYYERVVPAADTIAKTYSLSRDSVAELIMYFVNQEPAQFVTAEKLQQIIDYDVPQYIEKNGAAASGAAPAIAASPNVTTNAELETLRREIATLKANQQNNVVASVRDRNRRLPPASGGGSAASTSSNSEVGMTDADQLDAASFRKFLKR